MSYPIVGRYRTERLSDSGLYVAQNPLLSGHALEPVRADKHEVTLGFEGVQRVVCMAQFRYQSGGLGVYVHLSTFRHSFGMLGRFFLEGQPSGPEQVRFSEGGTTTTHLVKYNHPASGDAHFSQDGKVNSYFIEATPLRDVDGHLFTVHYWGLDGFDVLPVQPRKKSHRDRPTVGFNIEAPELAIHQLAGRIVGWCFPRKKFAEMRPERNSSARPHPVNWLVNGESRPAIVIGPRSYQPDDDLIILLTYNPMETSAHESPKLVFIGGFDRSPDRSKSSTHLQFLALKYSQRDEGFDEMAHGLNGTIDRAPNIPVPEVEGGLAA
jgi:hypothetical protein